MGREHATEFHPATTVVSFGGDDAPVARSLITSPKWTFFSILFPTASVDRKGAGVMPLSIWRLGILHLGWSCRGRWSWSTKDKVR